MIENGSLNGNDLRHVIIRGSADINPISENLNAIRMTFAVI
jgi:hypothetical protein